MAKPAHNGIASLAELRIENSDRTTQMTEDLVRDANVLIAMKSGSISHTSTARATRPGVASELFNRCSAPSNCWRRPAPNTVGAVLEAQKRSVWAGRYDVIKDGHLVATWEKASWRPGGMLEVEGDRFVVRSDLAGRTCSMVGSCGAQVATADGVGRNSWTIDANGTTYRFRRASPWRQTEQLHIDGRAVGSIRRTRIWRGDAKADLPAMPLAVEAFALAVVLLTWDIDAVV